MISRFIFCAAAGVMGLNATAPAAIEPLTSAQLQAKAKYKSVSNVCNGKRKTKVVKDMCARWEKHDA